jgi:glycosyltransferase involved in cell wall biosynthesis
MPMENLISFIIPAYNSENTIKRCIVSVMKQDCPKEIIVVDGHSTDRTREIVNKYPVTLVVENKPGAGAARNLGSAIARGIYLAFVDADAVLPLGWARKAKHILKDADDVVAGVAGPVLSIHRNLIGKSLDGLSIGTWGQSPERFSDALNTTAVLFKASVFQRFKFDENFIRGEDTEIGFRMTRAGYTLLLHKELYVFHHYPTTLSHLMKKWFSFGRSYPLSYLKHRDRIRREFYGRLIFIPLLCVWGGLSFLWGFFALFFGLQLLSLLCLYAYIGLQIPEGVRGMDILTFSFVHMVKQLAKLVGIWYGFIERLI